MNDKTRWTVEFFDRYGALYLVKTYASLDEAEDDRESWSKLNSENTSSEPVMMHIPRSKARMKLFTKVFTGNYLDYVVEEINKDYPSMVDKIVHIECNYSHEEGRSAFLVVYKAEEEILYTYSKEHDEGVY